MNFGLVHPVIIDLYVHILHLNEIGYVMDGYIKSDLEMPDILSKQVEDRSKLMASSEKQALKQLGGPYIVQSQLNFFHDKLGVA